MHEPQLTIPLSVSGVPVEILIFTEGAGITTTFEISKAEAIANGEAPYQICEGCFYEYRITDGFYLELPDIVSPSKVNLSSGRLSPNIYVGTLSIDIKNSQTNEKCGIVLLEVRSVKTTYREDYRYMLEEITEKCTDLLLQHSSPASQFFEVDFNADAATIYQRFAFLKSVLDSQDFNDSVHKILSAPVTKWKDAEVQKDVRGLRKINNKVIRQITTASNRIDLPEGHPLRTMDISSIPSRINTTYKTETVDTPENRFVKHALMSFLSLISEFRIRVKGNNRLYQEALLLEEKLEQFLSHSVFKEISSPTTLPLNSPVLQRKEGYREILRIWLMFDLAAKLVWRGGDDVYSGGKRDVATLYEYWLFFKLLEIVRDVFKIESASIANLVEYTSDGMGLKLKQGKFLPIQGVYISTSRKLNVEFSYNRTFSGNKTYPDGGSWTRQLRPDYTLSVWPHGIDQDEAEKEELIVHIQFDAKYKIENLAAIFGEMNDDLDDEKEDQKKGSFKRADILKMHTYRDAIRRTAGAYVLYPGSEPYMKEGFHELLPGLGAFAVRPSRSNNGTDDLRIFLSEVVQHFLNRTSQREKMSLRTYQTYKDKDINLLSEPLPEAYGAYRSFQPDDITVLVGFYKSEDQLNWIIKNNLYNTRIGSDNGSIHFDFNITGTTYLLLHGPKKTKTTYLFKLVQEGPRLFSNGDMLKKKYPDPSQPYYLVFRILGDCEDELKDRVWDVAELQGYQEKNAKAWPFSTTLTELLMKNSSSNSSL